jgi:mxaL protein
VSFAPFAVNMIFDMKNNIADSLRGHWDRWLVAFASLLLAITFLRPSAAVEQPLFEYIVVLDITQSMNVQDYTLQGKPSSRLDYVKYTLGEALKNLPCGSKLGWGIFTEYRSFLLLAPIEVCENYSELASTLAQIDGRMAWTGNSEIAKGYYAGLTIAGGLESKPGLVFISDGQESPPLNPRFRPAYGGKKGAVRGLLVGAGGLNPLPIPKVDPGGRPLGYWRADEVMQTDPRSLGRGGSVSGESMVEDESNEAVDPALKGTRGSEHLSSLREAYLKLLAAETGLSYYRLQTPEGLLTALTDESLARQTPSRMDLRYMLAGLALLCLLSVYLPRTWRPGKSDHAVNSLGARTAARF